MAGRADLAELIAGNDLDGLIRLVDGLSAARDWDGIVELRDRSRDAVDRGKQLWGAAQYAEYRLALDAPAEYAGPVAVAGAARFAAGPLWEVAASTHTWSELEPHLPAGPGRTFAAHERMLRGDDLEDVRGLDPHLLEIPLRLASWEPGYPVAVYRSDGADFPEPDLPVPSWTELPPAAPRVADPEALDALYHLTAAWVEQSNGRGEVVAVAGDALGAIAAFGPRRARVAEMTPAEALAHMAWAAASGGAHGRRRGSPVGRHDAWWAAATLVGMLDDWPPEPSHLGEAMAELRWYRWDPGDATAGWGFHLAVEDPEHGLAWAATAADEA